MTSSRKRGKFVAFGRFRSLKELTVPAECRYCPSPRVNPTLNLASNSKLYLSGKSTTLSLPRFLPNFQPNEARAYTLLQVIWRLLRLRC